MTKTYSYDDSTQLTAHFNASEFRCKCDEPHDFQLNDELVQKLEALFAKLNCSKITVTSGFRCEKHDSRYGSKGNAADICCYGQDAQPISSKKVCQAAQDIGFTGIANITAAYIYTHVDVRPNGKWYGDETVGNSTVTNNFYDYFKEESTMKGIDVSVHNGAIDWSRVKASGIQFAILRAGYGKLAKQKDTRFEENYSGAKAVGMPVGAYWYSYATTVDEVLEEAAVCISVLKGKQFDFPIYFDQEEKAILDTGKENCSALIRAFCDALEKAGYWAGLYTSRSCLTTHIEDDIKTRYALWAAEWGEKLNYSGTVGIWQHSEKGHVDGISGNVDLDIGYRDYPQMIKNKGLNGYGTATPTQSAASDNLTVEVTIDGKKYSGKLNKA